MRKPLSTKRRAEYRPRKGLYSAKHYEAMAYRIRLLYAPFLPHAFTKWIIDDLVTMYELDNSKFKPRLFVQACWGERGIPDDIEPIVLYFRRMNDAAKLATRLAELAANMR